MKQFQTYFKQFQTMCHSKGEFFLKFILECIILRIGYKRKAMFRTYAFPIPINDSCGLKYQLYLHKLCVVIGYRLKEVHF